MAILRIGLLNKKQDVGEPLTTISKLLGHSKLETTKIYTMPGERDLEKAVDKVAWV